MRGKPRMRDSIFIIFNDYLSSTTAHGFSYLANPRTIFEVLYWICAIGFGFTFAASMLSQSAWESYNFPISTTVNTISIQDVPFPAVTIDAGEVVNPWGFAERMFDLAEFECYEDPFNCERSAKLKEDFEFLLRSIFEEYSDHLLPFMDWVDITELEILKKNDSLAKANSDFKNYAALLAMTMEKDEKVGAEILNKIIDQSAKTIAMFTVHQFKYVRRFAEFFYPMIEEGAAKVNLSKTDTKSCAKSVSSCPGNYWEAYMRLLAPFVMNKPPYQKLGFGQLISYFTRTLRNMRSKGDFKPFLSRASIDKSDELQLTAHESLVNMTKLLTGDKKQQISTFELSKMLFMPQQGDGRQAQVIQKIFSCGYTESSIYFEKWEKYIEWLYDKRYHFTKQDAKDSAGKYPYEPPCSNSSKNDYYRITECCKLKESFSRFHKAALEIMKWSIQPPHYNQSTELTMRDIEQASKVLNVPIRALNDTLILANPRVAACKFNGIPENFASMEAKACELFQRSYTDSGFGYTFNGMHFFEKHSGSNAFNQRFYNIMELGYGKSKFREVMYPKISGSEYGLQILLQLNKYREVFDQLSVTMKGTDPSFKITVHSPYEPASLRIEGVTSVKSHQNRS